MTLAARSSSSIRTACRLARTSSRSIAGLRMSPSSPPVQHTRTVRTPWSWYLATVPAPFDDSSSGWAWTVRRQRSLTAGRLTVAVAVAAVVDGQVATAVEPATGHHPADQADHGPHRHRDPEQAGADD